MEQTLYIFFESLVRHHATKLLVLSMRNPLKEFDVLSFLQVDLAVKLGWTISTRLATD